VAGGYTLPNDGGISPTTVDTADYTYWVSRFGQITGAGSLGGGPVPEPASTAMLLIGAVGMWFFDRRHG
jgi:hypothetical protein